MSADTGVLRRWRRLWELVSIYLPVMLMGVLALSTYWLVKNTPVAGPVEVARPARHEPDYFMRGFAVRTFDADGTLKSEVFGAEGRHYPDTDTLEIDQARIRSFNKDGRLVTATARRALSNGDGSEVQLFGDARVVHDGRSAQPGATVADTRMEFRSEFLHAFMNDERVQTHKPVQIDRGRNRFTADSLDYSNIDRLANLQGRVRGVFAPRSPVPRKDGP